MIRHSMGLPLLERWKRPFRLRSTFVWGFLLVALAAAPNASAAGTFLFVNQGDGTFTLTNLVAWVGARDLAAGDFDGDGLLDLAVAGTTNGVAHFHSLGGGAFELVTNIVSIGTTDDSDFPQPAFYLKSF